MADRTAFESQCDEIAEMIDKMSDWERLFYMYCLLPHFIATLEKQMDNAEPKEVFQYMAREALRQDITVLRRARESLGYDLF